MFPIPFPKFRVLHTYRCDLKKKFSTFALREVWLLVLSVSFHHYLEGQREKRAKSLFSLSGFYYHVSSYDVQCLNSK